MKPLLETQDESLERYCHRLDEMAEASLQLAKFKAYALGLTRGFIEGFGLATVLGFIAFCIWWHFHA